MTFGLTFSSVWINKEIELQSSFGLFTKYEMAFWQVKFMFQTTASSVGTPADNGNLSLSNLIKEYCRETQSLGSLLSYCNNA